MTTAKSPAEVSKRAFILSLPAELSAKEVVEKAKEQGITFAEQYVWGVRSAAKQLGAKRAARAARRPKTNADQRSNSSENEFRRIALELGLGKSRELLQDTARRVADLIQGK